MLLGTWYHGRFLEIPENKSKFEKNPPIKTNFSQLSARKRAGKFMKIADFLNHGVSVFSEV